MLLPGFVSRRVAAIAPADWAAMRTISRVSLVVGVLAGAVAPIIADLHVYRVTSGYSGKSFWLTFPARPAEKDILDAVIYREPLIKEPRETQQFWRTAQREKNWLRIKKDSDTSIVVMPYESDKDPDDVYADGWKVRGIWLTEPSTRTEYPVFAVVLAYALGSFVILTAATFVALLLLRFVWYFILRRVSEFSQALRGKE